MWILVAVVAILIIGGGVYYYSTRNSEQNEGAVEDMLDYGQDDMMEGGDAMMEYPAALPDAMMQDNNMGNDMMEITSPEPSAVMQEGSGVMVEENN